MLCDAVAIQSSAEPLRSLAHLSLSVHRPCFTSPTLALPLRFCARLHASPSRFDSSQCHCQTMLRLSFLCPCVSVRGDSLLCHSISIRSGARPCRCFSGRIEATHFDTQPSRVTASQYFAFTMRTSPSHSVAAPRQSPLFHCVAEIRIAPQSLCCSSGSKTELSLPYAVLDCAALHLSVATPCAA